VEYSTNGIIMFRKQLITLIFYSLSIVAYSVQLEGIVRDAQTREPLIGASVFLKNDKTNGTTTGLDGSFILKNLKSNKVTLICSYISYKTLEKEISIPLTGVQKIYLELVSYETELHDITVIASNKNNDAGVRNMERLSPNVLNIVSARSIEISPDMTVANVLGRVSGVTLERNSSGDGQYAILRGMDKRYNYTLVNSIKIPSPDNKNRFVPLDIFPSELLDRLEVTKSLTADMEADGIGGAVNLVMKDAPSQKQITANISTGYNALFLGRNFNYFNISEINKKSPYELYGEGYKAKIRDFSTETINLQSSKPIPNVFGGFSYGNRFIDKKLGFILAGSFQNSYRGSNSNYFSNSVATSDVSNLPVLTSMNNRIYSEQQTRVGLHTKLDYKVSKFHKIQLYSAFMVFTTAQVRDVISTDYSIGYNPTVGDYNLSFNTRFRWTQQQILNNTLKGKHQFGKFQTDWSAVYSLANNQIPDNTTVYTVTTVRNFVQNPISVTTLGGAQRRWEHNSDQDLAGNLNLRYDDVNIGAVNFDFSVGGIYRNKKRTNFFNQYEFRPFDESKPLGNQNNLIKGVDWNSYPEIKFMVYNPYGTLGNPLNYDASENISAGYGQLKMNYKKFEIIAGLRIEHTNQGYDLKYAISGVENNGKQIYTDFLPSANIKYFLTNKTNLRASYFKSLNRPGFFEIVPYRILNEDYTEAGNPELKHTIAHNVDIRFEYFPKHSEQILIGVFYKNIQNPIELGMLHQGQATFYTPTNFGDATNYGVEIDFIKYFYFVGIKANYTYTNSNIATSKLTKYANPDPNATDKILIKTVIQNRPLNGQAQHVANLSFLYKNQQQGWDGQLALSYTGDRLYAISRYLNDDIYQSGYFQMDASLEKKLDKGFILFLKASNILDTPMIQYLKKSNPSNEIIPEYEKYKGGTLIRKDYYGQNFQIGCRYKF